jgi:hypothetical protein
MNQIILGNFILTNKIVVLCVYVTKFIQTFYSNSFYVVAFVSKSYIFHSSSEYIVL